MRWPTPPHIAGSRVDFLRIFTANGNPLHNVPCIVVGTSPENGTPDVCLGPVPSPSSSSAIAPPGPIPVPVLIASVPTLSEVGLVLLALLVSATGILAMRRREAAVVVDSPRG